MYNDIKYCNILIVDLHCHCAVEDFKLFWAFFHRKILNWEKEKFKFAAYDYLLILNWICGRLSNTYYLTSIIKSTERNRQVFCCQCLIDHHPNVGPNLNYKYNFLCSWYFISRKNNHFPLMIIIFSSSGGDILHYWLCQSSESCVPINICICLTKQNVDRYSTMQTLSASISQ